jgi:hypothetical protein
MFLFKRKQIVLDTFTMSPAVHAYYPIEKANKFLPEWWKNLPKSYIMKSASGVDMDISTLKRCNGFIDCYSSGFMIPLWSDLNVKIDEDRWSYQFSFNWSEGMDSLPDKITSHDRQQYGSIFDNHIHLKLSTPWVINETKGIKFYFGQPTWNNVDNLNRFHILPGVVDFKYQHTSNINFIVPNKPDIFKFEAGYPIVHLIPLSEHDIVIKNHLVSREEYNRIFLLGSSTSFSGIYKKHKSILSKKETKCPFGFN